MAYRPHRYGGVGGTNGHQPSSVQPSGSNGVTTGAAGTASNGNGAASGVTAVSGASGGDLYKQLIDNNDLVRELDDIEAISQQISQACSILFCAMKCDTQILSQKNVWTREIS